MGFYDGSQTQLWKYAQHYTLADHFFQAAFGGSFLNHLWLICACTPVYPDAPIDLRAQDDVDYKNAYKDNDTSKLVELLKRPDQVTYDGFAVNTLQPLKPPHKEGDPTLPCST